MFQVINANVNGIRAAARKGFFEWLEQQQADVVCLQETKAQMQLLSDKCYRPAGYNCYFHDALKKGYSGVALYSRIPPEQLRYGLGWDCADQEGRYLEARFGKVVIASLYMPSGSSGPGRQALKFEFLENYRPYLQQLVEQGYSGIICGDWNIAHQAIDLKNWRANQKNSGFLPEERAWLDQLFNELGWVDAFRIINQQAGQYTWWSQRGQARAHNVGWRIDYQIVTPDLRDKIHHAYIYTAENFSDHAPLIVSYDLTIR